MTFSLGRIYAIFNKDMKDLSKNMFVLSTALMPLFFAFLFGRGETVPLEIHFLVINLTLTAVAVFVQASLIAEEKEKNTLRTLMMSPAGTMEILIGKSLVTAFLTIATLIICMRITGYVPENGPVVYAGLALGIIFFLTLGTLMGLLTRSLIEASVVALPVLFLFGMGNLFVEFFQEYEFLSVLDYLPNFQLELLAAETAAGAGWAETGSIFLVLTAWTVAAAAAVIAAYRYNMKDN
ncbi:ABC transporter permease [Alkalicoccus saliphilus]|uniref:ABC transporter n=1 Tax=Alkalicoccus saliphilus TaxID=200989 RepID=A0A2T4U1P5_9BACI|nr:ABC transporter permease [Alkalicoccus saliphilus]PTL37318.1 ABC transporter [Alkalicoccus saliphilus]